ncbi:hypothetical protein HDE_03478 [Halotydeus destructor]|nr:hypothetical protein HDE_03478 [Halotydeus destructor]
MFSSILAFCECTDCSYSVCHVLGTCAKIYQHEQFEGKSECILPSAGCVTLDTWWQDYDSSTARVSSVDTFDQCAVLWSGRECTGDSRNMFRGSSGHSNLADIDFGDKTRSISSCIGKDELSGKTQAGCHEFPLFTHQNSDMIESDTLKTLADIATATSIIVSATPLGKFAPILDGFTFILTLIENDKTNKGAEESKLDEKITKHLADHVSSEFKFCKRLLGNISDSEGLNASSSTRDIEDCHNRMVTVLIDFGQGSLFENPLASSPYLVAFTPIMLAVQRLTMVVNPNRKQSFKDDTKTLIKLLEKYESKALMDRLAYFRGSHRGYYDDMIGKTIISSSQRQLRQSKFEYGLCYRDAELTVRNRLEKFFAPAIETAQKHLRMYH